MTIFIFKIKVFINLEWLDDTEKLWGMKKGLMNLTVESRCYIIWKIIFFEINGRECLDGFIFLCFRLVVVDCGIVFDF